MTAEHLLGHCQTRFSVCQTMFLLKDLSDLEHGSAENKFFEVPPGNIGGDMGNRDADELLEQKTVCRWLKIKDVTAEAWRGRGTGPRYVKVGRLIRYRRSDVEAWLKGRVHTSTSHATATKGRR